MLAWQRYAGLADRLQRTEDQKQRQQSCTGVGEDVYWWVRNEQSYPKLHRNTKMLEALQQWAFVECRLQRHGWGRTVCLQRVLLLKCGAVGKPKIWHHCCSQIDNETHTYTEEEETTVEKSILLRKSLTEWSYLEISGSHNKTFKSSKHYGKVLQCFLYHILLHRKHWSNVH